MTKRDMIADFLSVKQLSDTFCEDGVLEAAVRAVVLHEIGRNKEKRKKPRKKRVTKTRINQLLQIISFLSNMFYEDGVLEAVACAVVLHEIGCNKEKRKKPQKKTSYKNTDKSAPPNHFLLHTVLKVFGRLIVQCFEPFNTLYD
jgi:hypothetical protein